MKRPTQKDVAELAGVSRGTVSMVLNGQTNGRVPISEDTRQRVLEAAEKLGYAPNPVAQMLAKGQNYIIGVFVYADVFPYKKTDYFFPYLTGIQHAAIRENYNVLLFTQNHHQPSNAQVYENSMNTLRLADGCIFMGANTNREELARLCEEEYPFVHVGRREIEGHSINYVINDYPAGTRDATQELIDFNHRKFGFIAEILDLEAQHDKIRGCRDILDQYPDTELKILTHDVLKDGDTLVDHIRNKRITALLCDDNTSLHRVLEKLKPYDIRVPQDLSIVSLTTADYDLTYGVQPSHLSLNRPAIGERAVEVLTKIIKGDLETPQQIIMPAVYVAGDTTGPCPA